MSLVLYSIIAVIILWLAYLTGRAQGWAAGFQAGKSEGFKKGQEEGMKAGIKERMISTLVETPLGPGMHADLYKQVKDELLEVIQAKEKRKNASKSKPEPGWLAALWEAFGGWILVIGFTILLGFLLR